MTKFLIVKDSADTRRLLGQMLSNLGEVYECDDGDEAFSAFAEHRPGWVLMAVKFGLTNGIAVTSAMKAAYAEARIVMVTMHGDDELHEAVRCARPLAMC